MSTAWKRSLSVGVLLTLTTALVLPCAGSDVTRHLVGYDATISLRCEDGTFSLGVNPSGFFYRWILPSGNILSFDNTTSGDMDAKYILFENEAVLRIGQISTDDFGLYICIVFHNDTEKQIMGIVKHTVDSNNPDFNEDDPLVARYMTNIKYGVVAGIIVLVVMVMLCYNYTQHQDRCDVGALGGVKLESFEDSRRMNMAGEKDTCYINSKHPEMFQYNEGFVNGEFLEVLSNDENGNISAKETVDGQTRL